jgi:hypothetical protein
MPPKKVNTNDNVEPKIKKKTIPKALKIAVWNKYIGEEIGKVKCLCCNITDITQLKFHTGHIISEANNGLTNIDNLKPICESCNKSMGTKNMDEFQQLLISSNKTINNVSEEIIIEDTYNIDILNNIYTSLYYSWRLKSDRTKYRRPDGRFSIDQMKDKEEFEISNTNKEFIKLLVDETKMSHSEYDELQKYDRTLFLSKIQTIIDKTKYDNINISNYILDFEKYKNLNQIPKYPPNLYNYIK